MRARCYSPTEHNFGDYGGRGIGVCARWMSSFAEFLADMGPRPSPLHTIERINNDADYGPGNCRWATRKEQARNRRSSRLLNVEGRVATLAEWAEISVFKLTTLHARLKTGMTPEQAVALPIRGARR